jgi:hypothetical protein
MAEIDRIANTPYPLAQRERQIAELEGEIDRLQRAEEAIVVGAPREPGSPPWVVLGVKAVMAPPSASCVSPGPLRMDQRAGAPPVSC